MISKEEHIVLSAEKIFSQKGFNGTSTREISKAADVNVSMISYYFGSKEKLFESIFEYRMKEGLDYVNSVLEKTDISAWEKLILIVERYTQRIKTLREFYTILQREQIKMKNPKISAILKDSKMGFFRIYQQLFEEGHRTGIFKNQPDMEFIHSTISGTLFMAINTMPIYKEFFEGDKNYEAEYFDKLNLHLKIILKHLLGYEENI